MHIPWPSNSTLMSESYGIVAMYTTVRKGSVLICFLTPPLHENGLWACSSSLLRDKKPTQPVQVLSLWEYFATLWVLFSLCSGCGACNMTLGPISVLQGGGDCVPSTATWEGGVGRWIALCWLQRETCWPWGAGAHYWSWSCPVSSLCK